MLYHCAVLLSGGPWEQRGPVAGWAEGILRADYMSCLSRRLYAVDCAVLLSGGPWEQRGPVAGWAEGILRADYMSCLSRRLYAVSLCCTVVRWPLRTAWTGGWPSWRHPQSRLYVMFKQETVCCITVLYCCQVALENSVDRWLAELKASSEQTICSMVLDMVADVRAGVPPDDWVLKVTRTLTHSLTHSCIAPDDHVKGLPAKRIISI